MWKLLAQADVQPKAHDRWIWSGALEGRALERDGLVFWRVERLPLGPKSMHFCGGLPGGVHHRQTFMSLRRLPMVSGNRYLQLTTTLILNTSDDGQSRICTQLQACNQHTMHTQRCARPLFKEQYTSVQLSVERTEDHVGGARVLNQESWPAAAL